MWVETINHDFGMAMHFYIGRSIRQSYILGQYIALEGADNYHDSIVKAAVQQPFNIQCLCDLIF